MKSGGKNAMARFHGMQTTNSVSGLSQVSKHYCSVKT
jgi:hypothetical protein